MEQLSNVPSCSKGWHKRCSMAKSPKKKCRCKCGGHNHNLTEPEHQEQEDTIPKGFRLLEFSGLWGIKSKCAFKVIPDVDKVIVVISELPDNKGTSITNASEMIATQIYRLGLDTFDRNNISWVEHYPASKRRKETFDTIHFMWNERQQCFDEPIWVPLSQENIIKLKGLLNNE